MMASFAHAQSYSVDWHKIARGGGTSTNGQFALTGTIGQPDACGMMTNGQYSVTGGFWSLINVVQTPAAPTWFVSHTGNTVTVYWQNVAGWNLVREQRAHADGRDELSESRQSSGQFILPLEESVSEISLG